MLSRLPRTFTSTNRTARPRVQRKPAAVWRPCIESLEDRMAPATVTWINPASGDWDTAANWSDGTANRVPGPGDDAVINTPVITVTHSTAANDSVGSLTSAATLAVTRGTLALGGASAVDSLNLSGGTLTGAGNLTVDTALIWTGGTMSGAGESIINGTAEIGKGGSPAPSLNGRIFDNAGTAVVDDGAALTMSNSAVLINESAATLTLEGTGSLGSGSAQPGQIANAGQLIHEGSSTSAASISASVDNTGTIDVTGGSLSLFGALSNEGTFSLEQGASASITVVSGTSSGDISLADGSVLTVTGSFTLQSGATAEFGTGAQLIMNGTLTQEGGTTVTLASSAVVSLAFGATYALDDGAVVSGPGTVQANNILSQLTVQGNVSVDTLAASDGTITVAAGGDLDVQDLTLRSGFAGGTLAGPGNVTVENSLLWAGGTMSGAGHTIVNGRLEVSGAGGGGPFLSSRFLDNFGTAVVDNRAVLVVDGGGVVTNEAGATITLQGSGSLGDVFSRQGQLDNAGQLIKSGTGTALVNLATTNPGTIDIQGGTLALGQPLTNTGSLAVESGAAGTLSGGSSTGDFRLADGSRLIFGLGFGPFTTFTLHKGATAEVAAGAVMQIGSAAVTQQGGAAISLAAGGLLSAADLLATYTLDGGATVSGPGTVQLNEGLATAHGNVSVDNLTTSGSALLTVAAGGDLDVQTFTVHTVGSGGLSGAGDLTVEASLLWTSGAMSGAGHTVVNGTAEFAKGGFPSPTLSGRLLDNFGTAVVDNGATLALTAGAVFTDESGGSLTLEGTGSLGGSAASGLLSNAGALLKTGAGTQSRITVPLVNSGTVEIVAGILLASAGYTQTGDGTLIVHIAGTSVSTQYGQLQVGGTATLDGTLTVLLDNGFSPSLGDSYRILTFTSRSGDFATENFPDLGTLDFNPVYDSTGLNLVVQSSS